MSNRRFRISRFVNVPMLVCIAVVSSASADGYTGTKVRIFLEGCSGPPPPEVVLVQNNRENESFRVKREGDEEVWVRNDTPRSFFTQGTIGSVRYGKVRTTCATSSMSGKPGVYMGTYWLKCNDSPVWHSLTVAGEGVRTVSYVRFIEGEVVEGERVNCEEGWMAHTAPTAIKTVAFELESIYVHFGPDPPDDYRQYAMLIENGKFGSIAIQKSPTITDKQVRQQMVLRRSHGLGNSDTIDRLDRDKGVKNVTLQVN